KASVRGQRSALIVADRLLDFLACIHHKRSVLHDRLEQRTTREQDDSAAVRPAGQLDALAIGQYACAVCLERTPRALRADFDAPLERIDKGVIAGRDGVRERRSGRQLDVEVQGIGGEAL